MDTNKKHSSIAHDTSKIGWIKIIKTIFNKDNTLAVTVLSAMSSAILCTIAYLYQRVVLLTWHIPPETIHDNNNIAAIYYIVFGILFFTSAIATQVVLRYLLFNSVLQLRYRKIMKRVIKKYEHALRLINKQDQNDYKTQLTIIKQRLSNTTKQARIQILLRGILVSFLCLLPTYLMLQLVITDRLSVSSIIVGVILILPTGFIGALMQVKTILPKDLKLLLQKSKHLSTDQVELLSFLDEINESIDRQVKQKSQLPPAPLERMWKTISRADIYSAIISIVVSSIFLIFLGITSTQKTDFWVYAEDDSIYAIVYIDGDKAVFKQALIVDNSLYLDLEQQKYESFEGKKIYHRKFIRVSTNPLPINVSHGIIKGKYAR